MGFDVTAASIILFIAATAAGSVALGGYWKNADDLEDARRDADLRAHEAAHTNMTITSTNYQSGPQRFTVQIKNTGSVVIDVPQVSYVVDGVYMQASSIESVDVTDTLTATDLWLPLETLEVRLRPVVGTPTTFQIVAPNGIAANWRP